MEDTTLVTIPVEGSPGVGVDGVGDPPGEVGGGAEVGPEPGTVVGGGVEPVVITMTVGDALGETTTVLVMGDGVLLSVGMAVAVTVGGGSEEEADKMDGGI